MKQIVSILILISTITFADNINVMNGYSKEPLKKQIFTYDYVVTQTMVINNYLNKLDKLDNNTKSRIKDDIYYLISSSVSELYKNKNNIIPKKDNLIMKTLFDSAQRLKIIGTNLAYYQLFQMKDTDKLKSINFTKDLKLSLDYDLFKLEDEFWSIKFPYYFKIRKLQESEINNSNNTIIDISTGGAKDKSNFGYSNANITLFISDKKDDKEFFKFWYKAFKVPSNIKLKSIGIKNYKTQYIDIKDSLMNNEITSWSNNNNSFVAVYSGLDGTFQENRQHFLDFLNSLANKALEKETR